MSRRYLMLGVTRRRTTLLVLLLITLATGTGLPRLRVDTGLASLIPDTDPQQAVYERITREFGSDNRTLIYIRDPDPWTPEKLRALENLHQALDRLDVVERVEDLFTLRSIRGHGSELESHVVLPAAPTDPREIAEARADALYNPLIRRNFVSDDGNVLAVLVSVRGDPADPDLDRRVYQALESTLEPARRVFARVFQVGAPRINAELNATLFSDLRLLVPLSLLVLALAVLVFFRSGFAAAVPVLTSSLSIAWTLGLMGWAGIPLNILSAMLPTLVVVVGSTEDTHMLAAYLQGLNRLKGGGRGFATRFMLRHMGVALLLTVLTTAIGFASNLFSGIGLIRDFALASTFAILANGLITILLVPLLLVSGGPTRARIFAEDGSLRGLPALFLRVLGVTKERFPGVTLTVTAVLCGFFLYHASHLYVTNDPLSYFRPDRPLVVDAQRIHQDLTGMKVFYITLESEREKAFLEPENLRKLVAIQGFIEEQDIFDRSLSLADHLALANREFHGGDPRFYRLPQSRELAAQYLLFFHRRDLAGYVSHDLRRANIVVRHNVGDSGTLNRHVSELRDVVAHLAGAGMRTHVVGENLMVNAAAEGLLAAQIKSLVMLLLVIFLIMSAMFTSLKGGFIALIPNLIPIVLMFGVMGLLDIPLNPGTAMVAVIAIGIAVDGTIHLFSRYNELCRRTSDYQEAVRTTMREVATPMVATSLALALGFGILLLSDFTLIAQFGALSAATMLFALFANLLITPIIMSRVRLVGLYDILALRMRKEVLDQSPLFRGLSNYQIRKAILISELNEFAGGDLLIEQGARGRSMYLILNGRVQVSHREGHGASRRLAVLEPGEVFGEIGFIRETRRTADVRALTPVQVLRFDYEKIRKDLKLFPRIVAKLNFNISCILGERLADLVDGGGAPGDGLAGSTDREGGPDSA